MSAAAVFLALLGACSAPGADAAGRRVVVGLYDAKGPVHLDLANQSHPELADVYSHQRQDASLKLAPDELMLDLVRDLDQLAFSELAAEGEPPGDGPAVRGWVSVTDGASRRIFVLPAQGASREQLEAFAGMKLVINEYYTHVGGLQFVNNPQGHDIFRKQP
jgi:hypothetical protein